MNEDEKALMQGLTAGIEKHAEQWKTIGVSLARATAAFAVLAEQDRQRRLAARQRRR